MKTNAVIPWRSSSLAGKRERLNGEHDSMIPGFSINRQFKAVNIADRNFGFAERNADSFPDRSSGICC